MKLEIYLFFFFLNFEQLVWCLEIKVFVVLRNILQILWEVDTFWVNVFLNFSVKCSRRIQEYTNSLEKDYFSELRSIESMWRLLLCLNMHSQKHSKSTTANKAKNSFKILYLCFNFCFTACRAVGKALQNTERWQTSLKILKTSKLSKLNNFAGKLHTFNV